MSHYRVVIDCEVRADPGVDPQRIVRKLKALVQLRPAQRLVRDQRQHEARLQGVTVTVEADRA